jgi:hypothetical protein
MRILRSLFETANASLRPLGLCLARTEADFQTSVPRGRLHDLIIASLSEAWGQWYDTTLNDESISHRPSICKTDFTARIVQFVEEYRQFNGKNTRSGGLFLNNTISLFAVAVYFDSPTVIDSGTYTGNSAWALSQACPSADIHSFDITHIALRHRDPRVTYHVGDWAGIITDPFAQEVTFGFFDDHVDQVRRIEECAARNVRYLVFDDDVPVNASHNGHNAASFPKLSFMFSESLNDVAVLEWQRLGHDYSVPIDRERLRRAKSQVAHYSRLPDLFPITGCTHQWPLALVVLKERLANAAGSEKAVTG